MSPKDMTLGEAIKRLNVPEHGCACVGGPYCCMRTFARAKTLQRGAHIVVKQFADLAQQRNEATR